MSAVEVASRPIFVVGFPRSGTTWTFELLASHPQVAGVFESLLLAPENLAYLHPRADWVPDSDAERHGHRRGMGQLIDREEAVRAARETLVPWLARAVEPEHRWLVEKTPEHALTLDAIADVFPAARIVHVVRDVRDAAVSRRDMRRSVGWPTRTPSALVMKPEAWRDAVEWDVTLRAVDAARARLPVHEVRYEDLRAQPAETLTRLFAFCEIPADHALVASCVAANDFAGHADTGQGRHRRRGRVGSWRDELGPAGRALISIRAGGVLAEKGYLRRPPIAHRAAFAVARRMGVGPS